MRGRRPRRIGWRMRIGVEGEGGNGGGGGGGLDGEGSHRREQSGY